MGVQDAEATGVDLTTTGTVAAFEPTGRFELTTVFENADGSVTVQIQIQERDGSKWFTYHDFGSVSSIQDSRTLSAYAVRVRITSTSLSSGETGDFYVADGD